MMRLNTLCIPPSQVESERSKGVTAPHLLADNERIVQTWEDNDPALVNSKRKMVADEWLLYIAG